MPWFENDLGPAVLARSKQRSDAGGAIRRGGAMGGEKNSRHSRLLKRSKLRSLVRTCRDILKLRESGVIAHQRLPDPFIEWEPARSNASSHHLNSCW